MIEELPIQEQYLTIFYTEEQENSMPVMEYKDIPSFMAKSCIYVFEHYPEALSWANQLYEEKTGKDLQEGEIYTLKVTKKEMEEFIAERADVSFLENLQKMRGTTPSIPNTVLVNSIIPFIRKRLKAARGHIWITNSSAAQHQRGIIQ